MSPDDKGAHAPVEDLTPLDAHVLVTRRLAPAVEENEALASLGEENEALASLEDDKGARASVEDLIPVKVRALTIFKGGREDLVLLLGKISSLWALEIKPLKILAEDLVRSRHKNR
jgi:hypothetical protein